ncbi:MAG: hypothetical protein ACTHMM_11905 [Agriterribacter sp.]
MNPQQLIFFCYSPAQRAFHVETAIEHLRCNAAALIKGVQPSYVVVGVYPNWDEYERNWQRLKDAIVAGVEKKFPDKDLSALTVDQIIAGNF